MQIWQFFLTFIFCFLRFTAEFAECNNQISDKAVMCPKCGLPMAGGPMGYEYRSQASLFGLPLVHIASGVDPSTGRPRVAKGIIAIGNIAVGGLAIGGASFGVVSIDVKRYLLRSTVYCKRRFSSGR